MKFRMIWVLLSWFIMTDVMADEAAQKYLGQSTRVSDHLWIGGQPDEAVLTGLGEQGIALVINNRSAKEVSALPFSEYEVLSHAGVSYASIPMGGGIASNPDHLSQFNDFMTSYQNQNVLLHCRSGGRSGQLMAAWLIKYRNLSPEKALQTVGRSGEITPTMQQLLGQESKPESKP